jgi:hypothetical protein
MFTEDDKIAPGAEAPLAPKGLLLLQTFSAAGAVVELEWACQEFFSGEAGN